MGTDRGLLLGVRGALGCPCGSGEVCALLPVRTYSSFPYAAEMHFLLRKSWQGLVPVDQKKVNKFIGVITFHF